MIRNTFRRIGRNQQNIVVSDLGSNNEDMEAETRA